MSDQTQPQAPSPVSQPTRPNPWRAFAQPLVIGGLVVAFVIGVGGTLGVIGISSVATKVASAAGPSVFAQALDKCHLYSTDDTKLGDGGKSLTINNKGDEDVSGISIDRELCILHAVKVPDSTLNEMEATRALDGRQTASWGRITASWSYHPDQGLDVILQQR